MIDVNLDELDQRIVARWLVSAEALALLGVRPQTLYASVSRGRIRTKADAADPRRKLYNRDDVVRLADRRSGRRKSQVVAEETIAWGEPVLSSAITTVARGRLWYRGQDAVAWAASAGLEGTAALLWQATPARFVGAPAPAAAGRPGMRRAFVRLASMAAESPPSRNRAPAILHAEAAGIVGALAANLIGPRAVSAQRPLHEGIAAAWKCPQAADTIRRALVLLADHELNASTFAARVTISTGASLAAGVLAGFATLTGPLHGGASAGVQSLVAMCEQVGADEALRRWMGQGLPLTAFGHKLYADTDVRAVALLAGLELPAAFADLSAAVERVVGERPNVDFALSAIAAAFALPPDAPLALFAIARSVGWIAHGLEQLEHGALIRPRARYTGPPLPARDA